MVFELTEVKLYEIAEYGNRSPQAKRRLVAAVVT